MKKVLGVQVGAPSPVEAAFTEMIQDYKEKFQQPNTTRNQRIQILTLLPKSWSNVKICNEFGASMYFVKLARSLKVENGILATPNCKIGTC